MRKIAGKTWSLFKDTNKYLYPNKSKMFIINREKRHYGLKLSSLENEQVNLEMKNLLLMIAQMKLLSQHVFPLFVFRCWCFLYIHLSIFLDIEVNCLFNFLLFARLILGHTYCHGLYYFDLFLK